MATFSLIPQTSKALPFSQHGGQFGQAVTHGAHPDIHAVHPDIHPHQTVSHEPNIPVVTVTGQDKGGALPDLPEQLQNIGKAFHALLARVPSELPHHPPGWLRLVDISLKEAGDGLSFKGRNANLSSSRGKAPRVAVVVAGAGAAVVHQTWALAKSKAACSSQINCGQLGESRRQFIVASDQMF